MGQLSVHAASVTDLADVLDDAGRPMRISRRRFGLLARQLAEGATVTVRDGDGKLCCIAGLWPEIDCVEAWFMVGPACRPHLLAVLRLLRRMLDRTMGEVGPECGAVTVRAFIHPESVAGPRLAARLGFIADGSFSGPFGEQSTYSRSFP